MPLPSGLTYKDRIGKPARGPERWFVCQADHGQRSRVVKKCRSQTLAEKFRESHDRRYHGRSGPLARVSVHEALDDLVAHVAELVKLGRRDHKTAFFYGEIIKPLKAFFAVNREADSLVPKDVSSYVTWRLAGTLNRSRQRTRGARIIKELKALRTALRREGIAVRHWRIPLDEIRAEKKERRVLTPEQIRAFVAALPRGSVQRACAVVKLRTAVRDVELYSLRVGDVDMRRGVMVIHLHNKRGAPKPHAFPMTDDVAKAIAPFLKRKAPDALVFTGPKGEPLAFDSFRVQFRQASRRAGIDPPLESIAPFRHHAITYAANQLGVGIVSRSIGHKSESTTQRYLINDGDLEIKRQVANAIAGILPLPV